MKKLWPKENINAEFRRPAKIRSYYENNFFKKKKKKKKYIYIYIYIYIYKKIFFFTTVLYSILPKCLFVFFPAKMAAKFRRTIQLLH